MSKPPIPKQPKPNVERWEPSWSERHAGVIALAVASIAALLMFAIAYFGSGR